MKYILNILIILIGTSANCQDVIPFELKEDNRIYLKIFVNQSDTLNFVFDLGANMTVLNKTRLKQNKTDIKFDSIVSNQGTNGISNEQISKGNSMKVGNKIYKEVNILGIAFPENDVLDGIIGWTFFKDKKVLINYESKELTIYDKLPKLSDTYHCSKLKFINDLPYIEVNIYKGKKKKKIWSMLDTAYNSELLVYYDEVIKNELLGQFQVIGEATTSGTDGSVSKSDMIILPRFGIGGFEIYNMKTYLTKTKFKSAIPSLMGGNLLKRFHMILDFEDDRIYMKPNTLINSPF